MTPNITSWLKIKHNAEYNHPSSESLLLPEFLCSSIALCRLTLLRTKWCSYDKTKTRSASCSSSNNIWMLGKGKGWSSSHIIVIIPMIYIRSGILCKAQYRDWIIPVDDVQLSLKSWNENENESIAILQTWVSPSDGNSIIESVYAARTNLKDMSFGKSPEPAQTHKNSSEGQTVYTRKPFGLDRATASDLANVLHSNDAHDQFN